MNDEPEPAGSPDRATASGGTAGPVVGLFVTCLVDVMRPQVGFAAARLLEDAGCRVEVPMSQTCCGQPAFNSGDRRDSRDIAKQVIAAFEGFDHVVVPSGSCAGMIREHYPDLMADEYDWHTRALVLAGKTYELTQFLTDVMHVDIAERYEAKATYHDSCSGLRELGIKAQPRALLAGIEGLEIVEGAEAETCCGFGGLFCVKYPDVSGAMVDRKIDDLVATGAETVLGGDLGCLMNIAGGLARRGIGIEARHVAEVLAGTATETPAIGRGPDDGDRT